MDSPDEFIGPVNLGNPHEITIIELAQTIIDMTGSSSSLLRKPLPFDDPQRRCPDISLAKEMLGWEPRVPLHEGLARTIEYFDSVLRQEKPPTPVHGHAGKPTILSIPSSVRGPGLSDVAKDSARGS